MSLATRCPSCSTVFRVVADQLKLRGGLVRCGRCNQVFKGTDHLLDTEGGQSRFLPALSVPTSMVAPPVFVTPHNPQLTEAVSSELHEPTPATNITIDELPSAEHSDAGYGDRESTDQVLADAASAPDVTSRVAIQQADLAALSVKTEDITQSEPETEAPEIVAEFDAGLIDNELPSMEDIGTESTVAEIESANPANSNDNPHAESPPSLFLDEAPRIPTENESRPMLTEPEVHFDLAEPLFDLEPEEASAVADPVSPIESEAVEDLSAFVEPVFEAELTLPSHSTDIAKEDAPLDLTLDDDELAEWSPPDNLLQEVSQPEPITTNFAYHQELALPVIHQDDPAADQYSIETPTQGTSNSSSGDDFPSFAAVLKHPASEDKSHSDNGRTEPFISSQFAVSEHTSPTSDVVALNDDDASQKLREQLTQSAQEDYQAMAEPSFLAAPHQRGKWLSVLLGLSAFIASVLLLFQAVYIWRDQIASTVPALEAPLVQFCQFAGCQLDFPKQIEQLAVESSDLAPVPNQPHHYVLTGLIRSRAEGTLALPVLELTLLDLQGQPVLRKVLTPTQYLPDLNTEIEHGTIRIMQNQRIPNQSDNRHFGIAGSSEIKLNTVFETTVENAVGYRAYIFYP